MSTVFTRIIQGELPGRFVWRDEVCVAFLSIAPITPGHTLVVPIAEVDHWIDLEPHDVAHLTQVAHSIGKAQMAAFSPTRIGLIVAGLEVPHAHLHVLPFDRESELHFANAKPDTPAEELDAAAEALRTALTELGYEPPT